MPKAVKLFLVQTVIRENFIFKTLWFSHRSSSFDFLWIFLQNAWAQWCADRSTLTGSLIWTERAFYRKNRHSSSIVAGGSSGAEKRARRAWLLFSVITVIFIRLEQTVFLNFENSAEIFKQKRGVSKTKTSFWSSFFFSTNALLSQLEAAPHWTWSFVFWAAANLSCELFRKEQVRLILRCCIFKTSSFLPKQSRSLCSRKF